MLFHEELEKRRKGVLYVVSYQKLALRLTTTALAVGGEVLPEEGVVNMATAVEVEQRSLGSGGLGVALGLGVAEGLDSGVEAVDVCLVVLGVVKLHDLAGDVGLERAVVVWIRENCSSALLCFALLCSVLAAARIRVQSTSLCVFRRLTRQIGKSRLATGEAGGGHGGERLCGAGAEAGAQDGRRAEEGGRHCCCCGGG